MDIQYVEWAEQIGRRDRESIPMGRNQEVHLAGIKARIVGDIDPKYRTGFREHGGDLAHKSGMVTMLWQELLDAPVYFLTLRDQLEYQRLAVGRLVDGLESGLARIRIHETVPVLVEQAVFAHLKELDDVAKALDAIINGEGDS